MKSSMISITSLQSAKVHIENQSRETQAPLRSCHYTLP